MSTTNIYGPHDDPYTGRCGYCRNVVDADTQFCKTGCKGIDERKNIPQLPQQSSDL
jgi:hypothetical protein